ncbi:hypothetical protein K6V92_00420 [Cupriavidus respiraculi]|uniref:hypothetical protein n=1 Tax=Cupriavidus respiraculi TaxID=195930 RepID=UPI001C9603C0|nr:hypothetical protein [Cupriavidus respiraculi]MBY4945088.1 hypothetical protein [Cupriavidus respiraculi]
MSQCTCPICRKTARWGVSKGGAGRVYITCTAPGCGVQIFARSDDADEAIRDKFIAAPEGADATNERYEPAPAAARNEQAGGLMQWD